MSQLNVGDRVRLIQAEFITPNGRLRVIRAGSVGEVVVAGEDRWGDPEIRVRFDRLPKFRIRLHAEQSEAE